MDDIYVETLGEKQTCSSLICLVLDSIGFPLNKWDAECKVGNSQEFRCPKVILKVI